MKTVQKGDDIKRLKDDEAEFHVRSKGYKYVPKSTYKGTKPAKKEAEATEETKPAKKSKKDK